MGIGRCEKFKGLEGVGVDWKLVFVNKLFYDFDEW